MNEIRNPQLKKLIEDRERLSEKTFKPKGKYVWDLSCRGARRWVPDDEEGCDSLNSTYIRR